MTALLSPAAKAVLAGFSDRLAAEDALMREDGPAMMARRDEFLLPIGEAVGEVLGALIVARGAKVIVEIGTSCGFSTLYLASAAARTGGIVHTLEIAPDKQAHARDRIAEAGLSEHVRWHLGDAVALIATLPEALDFVLIDVWKELYVPCPKAVHPKLANRAVIAADNILYPEFHRPEAEAYRARVRAFGDMESVLLPIGAGIELSCRRG